MMDLSATMQNGLGGTLRLGTSATIGPYLMPYVVGDLRAKHPDLKLYIREAPPRELLRGLTEGDHDLILTQLPAGGNGLSVARLFREPLFLTMPNGHKLAAHEAVPLELLEGETVLSLLPSYTLHDQIAALAIEYGATLARDYEGTSLDALRQMVAMGMGLTLLPALYVASEIEGRASDVVVRPVEGKRLHRSVGLVWRGTSGASDGFARLAASVRKTAGSMGELTIEA